MRIREWTVPKMPRTWPIFPTSMTPSFGPSISSARRPWLSLTLSLVFCGMGFRVASAEQVSFSRDVMAVLSKAGCNMGACHGNANGKGNLRISLRGENAQEDAATLRKDLRGKLVNIDDPAASFLLRKPTLSASHEGGKRFAEDSLEYQTLRDWIAQGAENDLEKQPALTKLEVSPGEQFSYGETKEVKLSTQATFADGTQRDVSRWAVYEPSNAVVKVTADGLAQAQQFGETTVIIRYLHLQKAVRLAFVPERPDFQWQPPAALHPLDAAVDAKLQKTRLSHSPLCDDLTFLKRASVDLLGRPPTGAEAKAFAAEPLPSQEKRAKLVDALLARREYGETWALRWSDLLRNEEKVVDPRGVKILWRWLRDSFNGDMPLDRFSKLLLTSQGSTYEFAPANYYRTLRDPATRAEATAQVFLGTRLTCAKCHNHPFERWTQTDYYQFAAVFDGLGYHSLRDIRQDSLDKNEHRGEQVVFRSKEFKFQDPRSKKAPTQAMLGEESPQVKDTEKRFEEMADWLTKHPLFAQVQVNRIWYHLMGQGIVDPVDDFRSTNPPSNPALLAVLVEEFEKGGRRVKPLVRAILLSRTYQLASVPNQTNVEDTLNYSRGIVRRLPAEPLLAGIYQTLGGKTKFGGHPEGLPVSHLPGITAFGRGGAQDDDIFLKCFGRPPRLIGSETERNNGTSLAQVFLLTSGKRVDQLLRQEGGLVDRLMKQFPGNRRGLVEEAFWEILARPVTEGEWAALEPAMGAVGEDRKATEDFLWAVLNSKEFLLRK